MPTPLNRVLRGILPPSLLRALHDWLATARGVSAVYGLVNPRIRAQRPQPTTALVVDGFPRSANGFASYALRMLLGDDAPMSTLTHVPDTIIRADRLGRPCVLLIRQPDEVVASLLTFDPRHTPASAFTAYARYYERLLDVAPRVVVSDFDRSTKDIPGLVQELNDRYSIAIPASAAAALTAEQVFARLDREAQEAVRSGRSSADDMARQISRPVEGRDHQDVATDDPQWASARQRAWRAYRAVAG